MYIHGKRIANRRKQLKMSQQDLADLVAAQQKEVSMYETGEREPSADRVYLIAKALNVSIDWLFGLSESMLPFGEDYLTSDEREALEIFRSTPFEQREKMLNVLKALA